VAQSVELLLDPVAESQVRAEWDQLAAARLPSERRAQPLPSHRPHITLYAATALPAAADAALPALVADLDLRVQIGGCLFFGSPRGRFVLVRQVVVSAGLLELQRRVADCCGAPLDGHFGPGRWSPHVTLARRVGPDHAAAALNLLGGAAPRTAVITQCRRWDGAARVDWLL